MALNHITIMGRLTRDPEMRKTGSGLSVANFAVAVDRDAKAQDGSRETDFIDCVAWRQTADFVGKYFRKGSMIVVSGRLQSRKWTDKDGKNRTSWEVVAENCYFGASKEDNQTAAYGGYSAPRDDYSESMAQISKLSQNQPADYSYPFPGGAEQGEYEILNDDDGQLPF